MGPTACGQSTRFTGCLTSEIQDVLVVVDAAKAMGAGLGPVADYAAMLAMAQPRSLDGCQALPSVVDLFAKGCPGRANASGMTRADVAYLNALYKAGAGDRLAAAQPSAGTASR